MNQEELTEAIAKGIDEGVSRVVWSFTKGLLIGITIIVLLGIIWIVFHPAIDGDFSSFSVSMPKNVNGWGNEYTCFFDNQYTPCGKTLYCATHQTYEECINLNGTWELETEARFWKQWYNFNMNSQFYEVEYKR